LGDTSEKLSVDYILSPVTQEELRLTTSQIFDLLDIENELINLINCYKGMFVLESTTFIHASEMRLYGPKLKAKNKR
jgi:hypothetical protein